MELVKIGRMARGEKAIMETLASLTWRKEKKVF
jgi:hypothetical protein